MPVSDIAYDNWGNMYDINMLYSEAVVTYELQTSTGTIPILEPVKWDQVTFIHKRDRKRFGFNYEFTGADIDLEFVSGSGREEIIADYNEFGSDAVILFRRKLTFDTLTIVEYEGRLNLGEMSRENYMAKIPCERNSLHTLVGSRLSTKIKLSEQEDLDGNPVPVYSNDFMVLPGQTLSEKFIAKQNLLKTSNYTETRTGATQAWGFFNVSDPEINTMNQTFLPQTLGITADDTALTGPYHDIFQFKSNGRYTFDISLKFQINMRIHPRLNIGGRKVTNADLYVYLSIRKPDNVTVTNYELFHLGAFNPNLQGFSYPVVNTTNHLANIEVEEGDRMQLFVLIGFGHNATRLRSIDFTMTEFKTELSITGQSSAQATLAGGYRIKRALDYMMQRMIGQEDVVDSNFYSKASASQPIDGCASNIILTNGGYIRSSDKFPITFSYEQFLNSMKALHNIGMGYEWDPVNQKERIRVEPCEYFYRDVEVIALPTELISGYIEKTANDEIYNSVNIGFNKYKEEEENSLDEIHAYHEYQTPIKNEKNEYLMKSDFLASGYLIETTRRAYFEDDENKATSYDDDIFLIDCYPNSDVLYTPVTLGPFNFVSGILSPETTLNQRFAVKRMIMAHAKWLNSSLVYKGASEVMKNTFTKQNKDYTSALKDSEECIFGDVAKLPLRAADHIILSVFGDFEGIYSPEWVDLKVRLNMTQVRMIINAHRGLDPDGKNYGYISFKDDFGNDCKGWLYDLSFNRESEEVSMTLLKKKFP